MRAWWLAALVAAGCAEPSSPAAFSELIDGCGDRPEPGDVPDWSKETLDYNVRGGTVRVPVVESPDGSTMDDWKRSTRGGEARVVETSRGPAFEIEGDARLLACSIQPAAGGNRCCAEQYLDGAWSLGPDDTRPEAIWIQVVDGIVSLDIAYTALSDLCGREATFGGQDLAAGWHQLPGQDAAWCT